MNKKMVALLALLSLLIVMTMIPVCAGANSATLYVKSSNGSSVHLRATPQDHCDNVITNVPYGHTVDVLGYEGKWTHVLYNGNMGYMMSRYLVADKPAAYVRQNPASNNNNNNNNNNSGAQSEIKLPNFAAFRQVTPYRVLVSPSKPNGFVNFRWVPSTSFKVMQRCYANTELTVIAENQHWAQVSDPETGCVGFMYRKYLTPIYGE